MRLHARDGVIPTLRRAELGVGPREGFIAALELIWAQDLLRRQELRLRAQTLGLPDALHDAHLERTASLSAPLTFSLVVMQISLTCFSLV